MVKNNSSKNNWDETKKRWKNELGCMLWASSCVVTRDGTCYYVDNEEENIREQMNSEKEFIIVEISKAISDKILKVAIDKKMVEEYCSVGNYNY